MVAHKQFMLESPFPVAKCQPEGYERSQGGEDYDADGDVLLHGAGLVVVVRVCSVYGMDMVICSPFLTLESLVAWFGSYFVVSPDAERCSAHVKMVQGPWIHLLEHTTNLDCLNKDETEKNQNWGTAWRDCRVRGFVVLTATC